MIRQREEKKGEESLAAAMSAHRAVVEVFERAREAVTHAEGATRESKGARDRMVTEGAESWRIQGASGFVARRKTEEEARRENFREARRDLDLCEARVSEARVALAEAMGRRKAVEDRLAAMRRALAAESEQKAEEDAAEMAARGRVK